MKIITLRFAILCGGALKSQQTADRLKKTAHSNLQQQEKKIKRKNQMKKTTPRLHLCVRMCGKKHRKNKQPKQTMRT